MRRLTQSRQQTPQSALSAETGNLRESAKTCFSSGSSQGPHRIEPHGFPYRKKRSRQSHPHSEEQSARKDHPLKREREARTGHREGPSEKKLGQRQAGAITKQASQKAAHGALKQEKETHLALFGPQCLHQTDLLPPFKNGCEIGRASGRERE